jgi:hypothetical protein
MKAKMALIVGMIFAVAGVPRVTAQSQSDNAALRRSATSRVRSGP